MKTFRYVIPSWLLVLASFLLLFSPARAQRIYATTQTNKLTDCVCSAAYPFPKTPFVMII